ncbi:MAG: hypothetical protein COX07_03585 [Bacteroidetes bacterium CG23_combo_of_CG06-09_8_20_14_all_32_9]|nr:MAG: hypothetical protein COX07_03585 [Bacteroidetes bacterium CG23_combo_of_CG06-09_8_20_14_all_32_9]
MIILLRQHSINIKNFFSNTEDKSLNWLKIFVIVFIILTFIDIFLYNKIPENIYCLIIIAFIGFLGYFSIKQTEIYTKNLSSENLSDFSTPHIKKMINVPSLTNHLGTAIEEQIITTRLTCEKDINLSNGTDVIKQTDFPKKK